ncbi:VOC family protein [Nocardia altamirensis]|uniref:VOC family protein n=1 Tax=Nocardia altamirensis TaxID=472158 RepID=UPI00083FDB5A|nr:VOC family protein [Nocardia altamirensis]
MPILVPGYHFGVVVADLGKAMDELTELLGLEWLEPIRCGRQVSPFGAPAIGPMMTFSKQGPPYFELLEQVPNSIWSETGLHHVGFFADDTKTESLRMSEAGFPQQATATVLESASEPGVCYHRTTDGLLVEIVEQWVGAPALTYYLTGAGTPQ